MGNIIFKLKIMLMVEAGSYITSIIAGGVYSIADGAFDLYCTHYNTRAYILTCVLFSL